jgi:hypothetical protein
MRSIKLRKVARDYDNLYTNDMGYWMITPIGDDNIIKISTPKRHYSVVVSPIKRGNTFATKTLLGNTNVLIVWTDHSAMIHF